MRTKENIKRRVIFSRRLPESEMAGKYYNIDERRLNTLAKPWTPEQIEYFENAFGSVSLKTIAKNLGKGIKTVDAWRYRHGYPTSTKANVGIPVYEFAQAVGVDDQTVYRYWIKEHSLPIKRFKPAGTRTKIMVDMKIFWKWAYEHRGFIDFSKFEPGSLGLEPQWVEKIRKQDFYDMGKKGWERPWTSEEDSRMIAYLKTYKYTYRQLSVLMNRTELSIQNRLSQIKCKYRPLSENPREWTEAEEETLIRMRLDGEKIGAIARFLGRNQLAVKNKWYRLKSSRRVKTAS